MDFNNIINLSCDIEYNNYKKKLIKKLFIQLQFIINIFDNEFNDNIIKLYILMKKNKLNSNFSTFILSLYDLVIELNNLKYIDQLDFLNIIIKLIRIYSLTLIITNNDNSTIIKLINWTLVYNKIIDSVLNLASNNRIIEYL
jgi:hypothetical protein